jgi:deoxyribonuclease-4
MPLGARPLPALKTAREIGCEGVQIFVTNPRGWREPAANPRQEAAFRAAVAELGLDPVVVHATYLINLASPRDDFFAQSVALLRATLERAGRYGAAYVVLHIGSHGGSGEEAGLARLAEGIRQVFAAPDAPPGADADAAPAPGPRPMLLLENDVGAGAELGHRFENLAAVLAAVPEHAARLGVCLDTAHLWGAGFDIGSADGAARTLADLDRLVGLRRVPVIHLNDTKYGLGSHRDAHARLGDGIIGQEGLQTLLRHPGLAHAAVLLETPIAETAPGQPDWAHDAAHLARVYALAGREVPKTMYGAVAAPAPKRARKKKDAIVS